MTERAGENSSPREPNSAPVPSEVEALAKLIGRLVAARFRKSRARANGPPAANETTPAGPDEPRS